MDSQKVFGEPHIAIEDFDQITPQESFIEAVNNCPVCNTQLNFEYEYNFMDMIVKEDADCKSCGIQIRSKHFSIQ